MRKGGLGRGEGEGGRGTLEGVTRPPVDSDPVVGVGVLLLEEWVVWGSFEEGKGEESWWSAGDAEHVVVMVGSWTAELAGGAELSTAQRSTEKSKLLA